MKNALWAIPAVLFASVAATQTKPAAEQPAGPRAQPAQQSAQVAPQATPQVYGRGRGGLPWAWNDQDRDGICDVTGRPVGQGRAIGAGGGRGRGWGDQDGDGICDFTGRPVGWGRGAAARGGGWGRGGGRGFAAWGRGRGGWWRSGYATAPAPVQPPASAVPAQPKQ